MKMIVISGMLYLACLIQSIEGDVVLQIHLHQFKNDAGKDIDGHCCDFLCASKCDHGFTFCVDEHASSPNDHHNVDFNRCSYYKGSTGRLASGNRLYFADEKSINGVNNPIVVKEKSWTGKAQFKIKVEDYDRYDSNDMVDRMYTTLERTPSIRTEVWTDILVIKGTRTKAEKTTLEIRYSVHCTEDYYGPRCDVLCVAQNSITMGHYTCDYRTGAKICLPGYEGPSCRIASNDCAPTTCRNGGTCIDGTMDFTCLCTPGYAGKKCQTELDHCASNPCQNGATCLNDDGQYLCLCPPSYVGTNCQYHICETANGCDNGGTCVGEDPWECYCPKGFTGTRCETNICDNLDCQNGGVCVTGACLCPSYYTGIECETKIDLCVTQSITCDNGGTCENGVCECTVGFVGDRCQGIRNFCFSNPCYNNATCYNGESGYFCVCKAGFFGPECQYLTTTSSTTKAATKIPQSSSGPSTTTTTTTTSGQDPDNTTSSETNNSGNSPNVLAATDTNNPGFAWWIYVVIGAGVLLVLAIILIAVLVTKYNRKKKQLKNANQTIDNGQIENFDNPAYDHESNIYENTPGRGAENNLNTVSNNLNLNIVPRDKVVYDVPVPRRQPLGARGNTSRAPARHPQSSDNSVPKTAKVNNTSGAKTPKELEDRYLALKQAALNG